MLKLLKAKQFDIFYVFDKVTATVVEVEVFGDVIVSSKPDQHADAGFNPSKLVFQKGRVKKETPEPKIKQKGVGRGNGRKKKDFKYECLDCGYTVIKAEPIDVASDHHDDCGGKFIQKFD
jgi:hypothetical protein